MKNWLGQELSVGDLVYRGARDGNTSSFKVGIIVAISAGKARVLWKYEPGVYNVLLADGKYEQYWGVRRLETSGSPNIDSLVRLDPDLHRVLQQKANLFDYIRQIPRGTLTKEALEGIEAAYGSTT